MPRAEWLAMRRRGIGGSDAAVIAGLSPFKSAFELYLDKRGELGIVADAGGSEAQIWGNLLEDVVAREFHTRTNYPVESPKAIYQHPTYPWMLANLDRVVLHPERGIGVLEVKTTSAWNADDWGTPGAPVIPDHYLLQMAHYLAVTGLPYGYFATLIGGQKFVAPLVERDDQLIADLIALESDFWKSVQDGVPPAPDGSAASTDILKRLYPGTPGLAITLPEEHVELFADYDRTRADLKLAEEEADAVTNKLKALMGEAVIATCGGRRATWKAVTTNRLNTNALKAQYPEIAAALTEPSVSRRFTVK
jgi:putative phage-type endonuclease